MTRTHRPWIMAALAIGIAVALAACTGGASGGGDQDDGLTPLEEYLGEGVVSPDDFGGIGFEASEMTEEEKQELRQIEDAVAKCMKEQGFEYVPYVPEESEDDVFSKAFSLPPEEFAKKYGYGYSTLFEEKRMPEEAPQNPNDKIRSQLSPGARKAYDKALWGEPETVRGGDGMFIRIEGGMAGGNSLSCFGKARKQVTGEDPKPPSAAELKRYDSIWKDIEALQKRIENDKRVREAAEAWAGCMADAGYPDFEKPSDAPRDVGGRFDKLFTAPEGEGGPASPESTEIDPEEREKVQEYEVEVATADYECRSDHYFEAYDEVRAKMEQQFVDDHKADLEAMRESNDAGGLSVHGGG